MPMVRAVRITTAIVFVALMPQVAGAGDRADVSALTRAYNASGQMLFRQFSAGAGNIVFSPYSIGSAMAMALAGARGDTAEEMRTVLQHALAGQKIDDANAAALATLNRYDRSKVAPTCPQAMRLQGGHCEAQPNPAGACMFPARLSDGRCLAEPRFPPSAKLLVANALMTARGPVAKDYAALLQDRYAAEVFPGARLETVNSWVKERTEGKIERILEKMSDVVLVNAVYFKSRWAVAFDKKSTRSEFFSLTRSRQEMVPTMMQRSRHSVVSRDGYRAIRLPYAIRALSMVIMLPDEVDGLAEVARRIDMDEFGRVQTALREQPPLPVVLTLPRFKAEYSADLKPHFEQAGMRLAFDPGKADFSGLTGVPPSQAPTAIDQIVHRAVIEVAEEATEAAAATAVGIVITSAPSRPPKEIAFRVDRPFLYYLVDDATGAVLFQGRVMDPR